MLIDEKAKTFFHWLLLKKDVLFSEEGLKQLAVTLLVSTCKTP